MNKKIEFAQMKTLPRYHLEWKWIPESNEVKECPLYEKDYETFPEAREGFSVTYEEDCMYAVLRDRLSGNKWEFTSGWLDHYPRSKWEEDEDDLSSKS